MKIFPALCTVAGTIFSCTNYFGVIFTGGVGKNGSTIAVSTGFAHFSSFPACCGFPAMTLVFISHEESIVVLFSIQFFDGLGKKVNIGCIRIALKSKVLNLCLKRLWL